MVADTLYYDLLEVHVEATAAEIKKAYKKKAMKHHPDKNPDDPTAHETFQAIGQAYETLIDPNERATYDQYGPEGAPRGGGMPDDSFNEMFGGMGGFGGSFAFDPAGPGPRPRRGHVTNIEYKISLEEAYKGKKVIMMSQRDRICKHCKGRGGREGMKMTKCGKCEGKGIVFADRHLAPGIVGKVRSPCPDCDGTGQHIREKDRCKKCEGKKVRKEKKRVEFMIDPGTEDGERIASRGEGDEEPDVPPGDVIFHINIGGHGTFSRNPMYPQDLRVMVPISSSEALLGINRVVVKHLDGRGIRIVSQRGERVIKHGDEARIRGEGMPIRGGGKGDLVIKFEVQMPGPSWASRQDGNNVQLPGPLDDIALDEGAEVVERYLS